MDPKIWGPKAWYYLHAVTIAYPDKPTSTDKKYMKKFFKYLRLPCTICQEHYYKNLKEVPLDAHALSSKKNLMAWLIEIHNKVNEITGKRTYSFEEAINKFNKVYEHA